MLTGRRFGRGGLRWRDAWCGCAAASLLAAYDDVLVHEVMTSVYVSEVIELGSAEALKSVIACCPLCHSIVAGKCDCLLPIIIIRRP